MDDILKPEVGIFRVIFLNVGQGDATLMIVPDNETHKFLLIDSNVDDDNGVNVADLLKSGVCENELIFINTHPHKDHLKGIDDIHKAVKIKEIWHSGHLPHRDNREDYDKMKKIISDIGEQCEFFIKGSNELNKVHVNLDEGSGITRKIGDVDFQVFAPAQHVSDDIQDEEPEQRRNRIHEQSGVIKFTYKNKSILITGDSDKKAWIEYITPYYRDVLGAEVLSASHHGSRSFFKDSEEDKEPFEDHIDEISPEYLIISAPEKSPHDHPHADAIDIYKRFIPEDKIFNLGKNNQSLIVDIDLSGNLNTSWECVESSNLDGASEEGSGEDNFGEEFKEYKELKELAVKERLFPGNLIIGDFSHRQKLEEEVRGIVDNSNYRHPVKLKASLYWGREWDKEMNRRFLRSFVSGEKLPVYSWLKFEVLENFSCNYKVYWQVVNTGDHARSLGGLRGNIFSGSMVQWERSLYRGVHWIQCYIVDVDLNSCIGKSELFFVAFNPAGE
ncbi:MAG: hypothetical protein OEV93_01975 [Candidatus Moranbacteria bacterium]|nr:hypothetical protein [Candidatus Moranbacteria bacterium]